MSYQKGFACFVIAIGLLLSLGACNPQEEKPAAPPSGAQPAATRQQQAQPPEAPPPSQAAAVPANLVVDVNGHRMTREQLGAEVEKRMLVMKDQIPQERLQEARATVRKRLIDDFVVRNLLTDEIRRQKIQASDQDIAAALEQLKGNLPPGVTIEELMKRNQVTPEHMNEEVRLGVQINKLVLAAMGGKTRPTGSEIDAFYRQNRDKFQMPESVHVRHILVAKAADDDDKAKAEKRAKAEDLRKQLLGGADFVETAMKSSDCPSRQGGGDLGTFSRGQMVKPFEDAAFSQKKGEIGPIVETEFGYHIIQVLEKNSSKTMPLDNDMKERILAFLTQQKQQEAFDSLVKNLREKAKIVYYGD